MTRHLTAVLLALASAALGATLVAPPAHAEGERTTDPAGDVRTVRLMSGGSTGSPARPFADADGSRAAGDATLDIRTVASIYRENTIRTTIGVRALARNGYQVLSGLQTPRQEYYVFFDPRFRAALLEVDGTEPRPCRGLVARPDRRTDTISIVVPASCVGNPASVRTSAQVGRVSQDSSRVRIDDGRTARRPDANSPGKYGPRLSEN